MKKRFILMHDQSGQPHGASFEADDYEDAYAKILEDMGYYLDSIDGFESGHVREVYFSVTDVIDRHEEFTEQDIALFARLCRAVLEGFGVE